MRMGILNLLRSLADRQEIADLLARYCARIDEYDIDGLIEVFTADCLTDYGPGRGGPTHGREALRKRLLASQGRFRRTHHQLGQIVIELDGDNADSVAYATASHELWDGTRQVSRLQYRDHLVRLTEGWRIAERSPLSMLIDGKDDLQRNWLARRLPSNIG
jgi:ketosteroid isomerase-like protein